MNGRDERTLWVSADGVWAIAHLENIPNGVHRSACCLSIEELEEWCWSTTTMTPRLSFSNRAESSAMTYMAYVRRTDLHWEVDSYRGERKTPALGNRIPDYPGVCLDCKDRVYVGMHEIDHKNKPTTCKGRVEV